MAGHMTSTMVPYLPPRAWQVSLEQARSVSQPLSVTVPLSHGQMYPGHTYRSASYPDQRYFGGEPPTYGKCPFMVV